VYARHEITDVWCCAYAVDDGEIKLWVPGDPVPPEFIEAANNSEFIVSAFNAGFERAIEQHIMAPRYGWPLIPLERQRCSQAAALAQALPASLDKVAAALNLDQQKDDAGKRVMHKMARPRRPRQNEDPNGIYWFDDPERRQILYAYCKQDVATERAIHRRIEPLIPAEQVLWQLNTEINERGIPLDTELLHAALAAAGKEQCSIKEEFVTHTHGSPGNINQAAQLLSWLRANGCDVTDIRSATLEAQLEEPDLPPTTRRVIELRLAGAHASANKLRAMRDWCDTDGRIRGTFRYHGASTGRFTSMGVQLQNLKRPETEDLGAAIDAVISGDLKDYDRPMAIIGDLGRAIIAARPGYRFIAADLSGIESRITAWVAGEQSKVDQWRKFDETQNPEDEPYYLVGRDCFDLPEDSMRGTGKIGDLAFGYSGGVGAWRNLAANDPRTDEEIKALQQKWRTAHPHIVHFWRKLDRCAISAVKHPGHTIPCGRLSFRMEDVFLKLRLPSGRDLAYPFARIAAGERGDEVVVFKDNKKGRFTDCRNGRGAYGGLWMENVVQAIARDIFAAALPALEAASYPIVLHVHDEIVSEVPEGFGSVDEFVQIITTRPAWADGLPLAAKGRNGPRFAKASKPAAPPPEEPPWVADAPETTPSEPEPEQQQHSGGNGTSWKNYDFGGYARGEEPGNGSGYVARYIYLDKDGQPYLRVNKKANRGGFPQERWTGSAWVYCKGDAPPPIPYRLPELLAAPDDDPVFICEGEKDADNVADLGLVATCNPGGAGKWTGELNKWFAGKARIVLLADNDTPGRMHVAKTAALLNGIAPKISTVQFPEMPEHGDVSDWLEQGNSKADLLERADTAGQPHKDRLITVRASDVEERIVEWFWPERLAIGKINLLVGMPDMGKGQIAAFLAAAATARLPLPEKEGFVPQGNVIWFNAEDDNADTIKPRLIAAGANMDRVHLVLGASVSDEAKTFNLVTDLPLLRDKIEEIGNVSLVTIDPVGSYVGVGKVNLAKGSDVRGVLEPLKMLAEELRVAILGIVHFNKKDDVKNAMLRIADSLALPAVARSTYAALIDPDDPQSRLFLKVKNNNAPADISGLRYTFLTAPGGFDKKRNVPVTTSKIIWTGAVKMTANEALAAADGKSAQPMQEAKDFLNDILSTGLAKQEDILKGADALGIAHKTLYRAKKELKIVSDKEKGTIYGGWVWQLPPKMATEPQDGH
jgi:DNA polymerase